jgi:site-specific recombinase XerC
MSLCRDDCRQTPTKDGFRIAPDTSAEIARWLSHLGAERRMSVKTLDAYRRDVSQFLSLTDHRAARRH